jgi:3-dehydroquinate synthase
MPKRAGSSLSIHVPAKPAVYPIFISQRGWLPLSDFCRSQFDNYEFVIISDSGIPAIHIDSFKESLKSFKGEKYLYSFPKGEKNKSLKSLTSIHEYLFEKNLGKKTLILALGGGVTGDIAGFVAATYKRGIPYIQIPTTLLSQIDSSIGSKTALNNRFGKNMIGAFHHPSAVFINLEVLQTLDERQYLNGIAECIKAGVIGDRELFIYMIMNYKEILQRKSNSLQFIIQHSLSVKQKLVEHDYYENHIRKVLNFGHTVGHALEKASEYKLLHGEAVALGMMIEAELLYETGKLDESDFRLIVKILRIYGLNGKKKDIKSINIKMLRNYLIQDKKRTGKGIPIIAIEKIGKTHVKSSQYIIDIDVDRIENVIEKVLSSIRTDNL